MRSSPLHNARHGRHNSVRRQTRPPHSRSLSTAAKPRNTKLLIIGGGISGYTLAFTLQQTLRKRGYRSIDITLVDKNDKPGGWIQTSHFPYTVETGPRSLLLKSHFKDYSPDDRVRWVLRTSGIESDIITPSHAANKKFIYRDGRFNNAENIFEINGPIMRNLHSIIHFALGKRRTISALSQILPNSTDYRENIEFYADSEEKTEHTSIKVDEFTSKTNHLIGLPNNSYDISLLGPDYSILHTRNTITSSELIRIPTQTQQIGLKSNKSDKSGTPSIQYYDMNRAVHGDYILTNMQRDAVVYGYQLDLDGSTHTPYYHKSGDILHPASLGYTYEQLSLANASQPTSSDEIITTASKKSQILQNIKQFAKLRKNKTPRQIIKSNILYRQIIGKHREMLTIFSKNRNQILQSIFTKQLDKFAHFGISLENDTDNKFSNYQKVITNTTRNNIASAGEIMPSLSHLDKQTTLFNNPTTPINHSLNLALQQGTNAGNIDPNDNTAQHLLLHSLDNTMTTYQQLSKIHQNNADAYCNDQINQQKRDKLEKEQEKDDIERKAEKFEKRDIISQLITKIDAEYSPAGKKQQQRLKDYGIPDEIANQEGLDVQFMGDGQNHPETSSKSDVEGRYEFPSLQNHEIYNYSHKDNVFLHDLGHGGFAHDNDMTKGLEYMNPDHNIAESTANLVKIEQKVISQQTGSNDEMVLGMIDERSVKKELLQKAFFQNGMKNKKPFLSIPNTLISSYFSRTLVKNKSVLDQYGQKDESVADFFGREVNPNFLQELIDPMIAGIYSGNPYTISMTAAFPDIIHSELKKSKFYPFLSPSIQYLFSTLHHRWAENIGESYLQHKLLQNLIKKHFNSIKFDKVKNQVFHPYYIFPNSPSMHNSAVSYAEQRNLRKFRKKYTSITFMNGMNTLPTHLHDWITNIHNNRFIRDGASRLIETGPFTNHSITMEQTGTVRTRVLQNTQVVYMRSNIDHTAFNFDLDHGNEAILKEKLNGDKLFKNDKQLGELQKIVTNNDIILDTESAINTTSTILTSFDENLVNNDKTEEVIDISYTSSTLDERKEQERLLRQSGHKLPLSSLSGDIHDQFRPVYVGLQQKSPKKQLTTKKEVKNVDYEDENEYIEQHSFDYVFSCVDAFQLARVIDHPLSHLSDSFVKHHLDTKFHKFITDLSEKGDENKKQSHKTNNTQIFSPRRDKFIYHDNRRNILRIHQPTLQLVLDDLVLTKSSTNSLCIEGNSADTTPDSFTYGSLNLDQVKPVQHFKVRTSNNDDSDHLFKKVKKMYDAQLAGGLDADEQEFAEEKSVLDDDYDDWIKRKQLYEAEKKLKTDFFTVNTLKLTDLYNYSLNYHAQKALSLLESINTVNQSIILASTSKSQTMQPIFSLHNDTIPSENFFQLPAYIENYLHTHKTQINSTILDPKHFNTYRLSTPINLFPASTPSQLTENAKGSHVNPIDQILLCRCGYWSNELPVDVGISSSFCTVNHALNDPFMSLSLKHGDNGAEKKTTAKNKPYKSFFSYNNAIIYPRIYSDNNLPEESSSQWDDDLHNEYKNLITLVPHHYSSYLTRFMQELVDRCYRQYTLSYDAEDIDRMVEEFIAKNKQNAKVSENIDKNTLMVSMMAENLSHRLMQPQKQHNTLVNFNNNLIQQTRETIFHKNVQKTDQNPSNSGQLVRNANITQNLVNNIPYYLPLTTKLLPFVLHERFIGEVKQSKYLQSLIEQYSNHYGQSRKKIQLNEANKDVQIVNSSHHVFNNTTVQRLQHHIISHSSQLTDFQRQSSQLNEKLAECKENHNTFSQLLSHWGEVQIEFAHNNKLETFSNTEGEQETGTSLQSIQDFVTPYYQSNLNKIDEYKRQLTELTAKLKKFNDMLSLLRQLLQQCHDNSETLLKLADNIQNDQNDTFTQQFQRIKILIEKLDRPLPQNGDTNTIQLDSMIPFKSNLKIAPKLPFMGNSTLSSISTALFSYEMSSMTLFNVVFDEAENKTQNHKKTRQNIINSVKGFGALVPTYAHIQDYYHQQQQAQKHRSETENDISTPVHPQLDGLLGVCLDSDTFPELYATSVSAHSHLKHAALSNTLAFDVLYGPYRYTQTGTQYKEQLISNKVTKLKTDRDSDSAETEVKILKTMTFMGGGSRYPHFIHNSHIANVKALYSWCQKMFVKDTTGAVGSNWDDGLVKPKYIKITKQYHCIPQPSIGIHAVGTAIQHDINTHFGYYLRTPQTGKNANDDSFKHAPHTVVWGDNNIATTSTNTSYTGNVSNDIYTGQGLIWPVVSVCGTVTNNPSLKFLMSNSVNVGMGFGKHIDI